VPPGARSLDDSNARTMNALSALGLDYDDDGEDSDDDDEYEADGGAGEPLAPSLLPSNRAAPVSLAAGASTSQPLPDAGNLLGDLPDEVDWDRRDTDDEDSVPAHDPKGTRYNSVALPASMAAAAEQHNQQAGKRPTAFAGSGRSTAAAMPSGVGDATPTVGVVVVAPTAGGAAVARRPVKAQDGGKGMLLPPQLRGRRNVATEDLGALRTAKRPKTETQH